MRYTVELWDEDPDQWSRWVVMDTRNNVAIGRFCVRHDWNARGQAIKLAEKLNEIESQQNWEKTE